MDVGLGSGGGGVVVLVDEGLGLARRVMVEEEGLGVALLQSTLPSGKFSL